MAVTKETRRSLYQRAGGRCECNYAGLFPSQAHPHPGSRSTVPAWVVGQLGNPPP